MCQNGIKSWSNKNMHTTLITSCADNKNNVPICDSHYVIFNKGKKNEKHQTDKNMKNVYNHKAKRLLDVIFVPDI
jgi:Na+-translocating ferredoxin:NAD+ oxidoreductase RNF subunit RnfB